MILKDIINGLGGGILSGVSDLIKGTNTTDKERLALQNEATRIVSDQLVKADAQLVAYEQELTKRQANDMQSDSWLSKNVRPMVLIFLIAATVLLAYLTIFILPTDKSTMIDPNSGELLARFKKSAKINTRWGQAESVINNLGPRAQHYGLTTPVEGIIRVNELSKEAEEQESLNKLLPNDGY